MVFPANKPVCTCFRCASRWALMVGENRKEVCPLRQAFTAYGSTVVEVEVRRLTASRLVCLRRSWECTHCLDIWKYIGWYEDLLSEDLDILGLSDSSRNTNQGVQYTREYGSGKLQCAMKVNVGGTPYGCTIVRPWTSVKGLRMSVFTGTRKMVNYAWAGWSQGKLWWRLEGILTCKLILRFGYRGERLIEPSSSWFPPKFPPG